MLILLQNQRQTEQIQEVFSIIWKPEDETVSQIQGIISSFIMLPGKNYVHQMKLGCMSAIPRLSS